MTHSDLVKRACRWLKNTRKCPVVLAGLVASYCSEIPDAIGWKASGESTLVECKVSRSDFLRDKHKMRSRVPEDLGMGSYRYYLTPPGLLRPEEVSGGWGLLEAQGNIIKVIKKPEPHTSTTKMQSELSMLISALRRYQSGDTTIHARQYGPLEIETKEPEKDAKQQARENRQWLKDQLNSSTLVAAGPLSGAVSNYPVTGEYAP